MSRRKARSPRGQDMAKPATVQPGDRKPVSGRRAPQIAPTSDCELIRLPNGTATVHLPAFGESMHPGLGPQAEADALHVGQTRLRERMQQHDGEFVIWDVGLGAAANAVAALRATQDLPCPIRLISFDHTLAPLTFALQHVESLVYLRGFEATLALLLHEGNVEFRHGPQTVQWQTCVADFPELITRPVTAGLSKPHVIFFDPFSPAKNPAMWTSEVFANLHQLLDPRRPCALTTYSRSTLVRAALLLAGFFVGRGRPSGAKEETTVAANRWELLDAPLDLAWLQQAAKSTSAEPLHQAVYRQSPLSAESRSRLARHPQFLSGAGLLLEDSPPPTPLRPRR